MPYLQLIFSLLIISPYLSAEKISLIGQSEDLLSADVTVELGEQEALFQDTLVFSTDNPGLQVHSWTTSAVPRVQFDTISNMPRQIYTGTVPFHVTLEKKQDVLDDVSLVMHYLGSHHQSPQERKFLLQADSKSEEAASGETQDGYQPRAQASKVGGRSHHKDGMPPAGRVPSLLEQAYEYLHKVVRTIKRLIFRFTKALSAIFTSSSSRPVQILVAFLLGLLMSLTPCIYPMIPITIGILGASSSNSWTRNFLLAGSYTIGMATIFAVLGLVTVLFGAQCGKLLCNPWFIVLLISFLAYCGGSMFGLYEFYIPRFLQPSTTHQTGGSLVSAFVFGIISGTFASPCMSPGLALILSAAATTGSYFLGFLLLFAFGIGVSMPLLIIGTFSGIFHFLPRAGIWMEDVKKAFGFLLIMMCFYYAQALIPVYMAWAGAAVFALICGTLYATKVRRTTNTIGMLFIFMVSTLLITTGLFVGYRSFMMWHATKLAPAVDRIVWNKNYEEAKATARAENKFVLADFTANWCPMCVLLDKEILQSPEVMPIFDVIIPVKIDGSSSRDPQYSELVRQFKILGIPQLLLIDPATESVIHVWGSELLGHPPAQFRDDFLATVKGAVK